MTKLDIIAAWVAYALQLIVLVIAGLQATGYGYFSDPVAMQVIAIIALIANLFEPQVKKAQDLYDKIQLLRKK